MSYNMQSNTALVHTKCKVNPTLFGQFVNAEKVISKPHNQGWLNMLRSDETRTYDQLNEGLKLLDKHIRREMALDETQFIAVGPANEIVLLGVNHPLLREIINDDGELCGQADIWQMNATLPPRKRQTPSPPSAQQQETQMLIPGFKRLSRQLQVDFAVNVHGGEGKRRREPVRSIYEEAALERANKKKRTRRQYNRKPVVSPSTDNDESGEISEIDDDELLRHAEMLASLSNASGHTTPEANNSSSMDYHPHRAKPSSSVIGALARAMDIVTLSHTQAMQAKDETIRAMEAASKALTETVNTQTALIAELLGRI